MSEQAELLPAVEQARPRDKRDASIDIIRGLCILSMVLAHVASGGYAYKITHAALWIDGAMGFVLLAGLVIGMVYRKVVERRGLGYAQSKGFKRARLLYVGHMSLCAIAFLASAVVPGKDATYATVESQAGWLGAAFHTLTLQVNPQNASILSLYAVLLVLVAPSLWLLAGGRWPILVVASLILYAAGHVFADQTTFPRSAGEDGYLNWGTWQALFFLAMVIGWHWSTVRMQALIRSRAALITATLVCIVCIGAAQGLVRKGIYSGHPAAEAIIAVFEDGDLGPGTLILSFCAALVLYRLVGRAYKTLAMVLSPIERLGTQSLGCYIILSIITIAVPFEPAGIAADAYALAVLAVLFVWTYSKTRAKAVV
ncbi:OpgC domain-containing protein [Pseudarthrobacter enclensis]|uniref:OpgC domain-containing protein n=1 Tax=Pseudarthrobacter enclensis TaxID=993070 RepID=UPI003677B09F